MSRLSIAWLWVGAPWGMVSKNFSASQINEALGALHTQLEAVTVSLAWRGVQPEHCVTVHRCSVGHGVKELLGKPDQ